MLIRNWVELAIIAAICLIGMVIKFAVNKKLKRIEGFRGINNYGPGGGWRMR